MGEQSSEGTGRGQGDATKVSPSVMTEGTTTSNATDLDILVLEVEGVLPDVDADDGDVG